MRNAGSMLLVLSITLLLSVGGVSAVTDSGAITDGGVITSAGRECMTALLVIDVQNLWIEGGTPTTVDGTFIVDKLVGVLADAREAGLTIVYTRDLANAATASEEELDFPDAIAPLEDDIVMLKRFSNAFYLTPLHATLEQLGITRVIVVGLFTTYCVADTVQGALDFGYDVTVLADAHGDGDNGYRAEQANKTWAEDGVHVIESGTFDYTAGCTP